MQFLLINYLARLNFDSITFGLRFFTKHAALLSFRSGISLPCCVSCRAKVASADNPTSFPGSLSYPSRDPGWVWSRVSQNLGDYKQTTWGRGG